MGRFALHGNERAGIVGGARHCELLSMADFAGRRAKRLELATRNSQLATRNSESRWASRAARIVCRRPSFHINYRLLAASSHSLARRPRRRREGERGAALANCIQSQPNTRRRPFINEADAAARPANRAASPFGPPESRASGGSLSPTNEPPRPSARPVGAAKRRPVCRCFRAHDKLGGGASSRMAATSGAAQQVAANWPDAPRFLSGRRLRAQPQLSGLGRASGAPTRIEVQAQMQMQMLASANNAAAAAAAQPAQSGSQSAAGWSSRWASELAELAGGSAGISITTQSKRQFLPKERGLLSGRLVGWLAGPARRACDRKPDWFAIGAREAAGRRRPAS